MDEQKNYGREVESELADIITEKPHDFTVGRKHFRMYPVTLAKIYLLKRYIETLGIDNHKLAVNPFIETLRLVSADKDTCCSIIAVHTSPNTYHDLYNRQATATRHNVFMKMPDEDVATLLTLALTSDKTEKVSRYLGIEAENERLRKVIRFKEKKGGSSMNFGGKSIFGAFIGQLKEMGYSDNEILFERGYSYLRLMLADKVTSLFISEEERKDLPLELGGSMIDANDATAFDQLKERLAGSGVEFI